MAEFSGKIVDAYYIDEEYSLVKILFDQDGKLYPYNVDVNPDHPDWQDFEAEGWTHEKLVESTAEFKKAQSAAFNIEVNNAAKALIAETMMVENTISSGGKTLEKIEDYFNLFVNDTDKDNLFKLKLWALETPILKAAITEQKSKLRKAESLLEVFAILYEIKKSQE